MCEMAGPKMIVQMAGLPGTGKTTIASELARRTGASLLSKDHIRHTLFEPHQIAYDQEQDDFCIEVLFGIAAQIQRITPDAVIILDGRTCSRAYQVRRVRAFADATGQDLRIIECVCAERTALRRLRDDTRTGRHPAVNRDTDLYQALRDEADPVPPPKLVLSTDDDLTRCVAKCLDYLYPTGRRHSPDNAATNEERR